MSYVGSWGKLADSSRICKPWRALSLQPCRSPSRSRPSRAGSPSPGSRPVGAGLRLACCLQRWPAASAAGGGLPVARGNTGGRRGGAGGGATGKVALYFLYSPVLPVRMQCEGPPLGTGMTILNINSLSTADGNALHQLFSHSTELRDKDATAQWKPPEVRRGVEVSHLPRYVCHAYV